MGINVLAQLIIIGVSASPHQQAPHYVAGRMSAVIIIIIQHHYCVMDVLNCFVGMSANK